ncbi:putative ankyrin 2,3/unc44 [Xylogone sp. PMI_703]|nr:putative ankyrin 2,3/unc44 [Xylogone sp. PMI_703]
MEHHLTVGDDPALVAWEEDAVMLERDDINDFNDNNILPQPPEMLERIRKWLKPTDYSGEDSEYARHLSSHLSGTSQWLLNSSSYKEWQSSKEYGLLWIRGVPGSGKSVFAAKLISHLRQEGVPVLYFFFRQIIDSNRQPVAALRDWLHQILAFSPPLQLSLKEYLDTHHKLKSLSTSDLWPHLKTAFSHLPKVYLVVDALDEMDTSVQIQTFLQDLAELGIFNPPQVKIIITSRPVQYIEDPLRLAKVLHIQLEEQLVDIDIATYIEHRLLGSTIQPQYHKMIHDAIPGRANGLFLYARLAMDALMQPGADIQQVIQGLPADLNVMYTELLREHARRTKIPHDIQLLILQFVTHATRPLRLLEVAQMINITQYPSEKRDLKVTKDLVRSACGPLLQILPSEVVCVVHHSLVEFLTGATGDPASRGGEFPPFEFGPTHNRLALICLSYLESSGLAEFQSSHTGFYVLPHISQLSAFTRYAGSNWFVHARKATSAGMEQIEMNSILDRLFIGENLVALLRLSAHPDLDGKATPLFAAVVLGLAGYAKHLLDDSETQLNREDGLELSPLAYAAIKGYSDIAELLLQRDADPMNRDGKHRSGYTPLHYAAINKHPRLVTVLLEAGVDPLILSARNDAPDMSELTEHSPLELACNTGHTETVSAFIPFLKTHTAANSALSWAACNALSEIVELLLKHPLVQVNAVVTEMSPLMSSSGCRDAKSVRCLLVAGADPNQLHYAPWDGGMDKERGKGFNALHFWASRFKRGFYDKYYKDIDVKATKECFRLLVEAGANIHQVGTGGRTPLHLVSDVESARLLVNAGADPDAVDDSKEALLHHCHNKSIIQFLLKEAKASTNLNTFSLPPLLQYLNRQDIHNALTLLEFGADARVVDNKGNGAFHYVAGISKPPSEHTYHMQLIEILLTAGVDINQKNGSGQTPLHLLGCGPSRQSRDAIDDAVLTTLIGAGADPEARDNKGQTPLFVKVTRSRQGDQIANCEKLIAAGASVTTTDYKGHNLLLQAARSNDIIFLKWLIDHGVNPKAIDNDGYTIFHYAIKTNRRISQAILDELVNNGVDYLQPNHAGRTPLHSISSRYPLGEHKENHAFHYILKLYKDAINSTDPAGVTALHLASTFSEYLAKYLLIAGADPSVTTHEGMTPFHLAARSRQTNILGLLLDKLESRVGREGMAPILDITVDSHKTALYYACASGIVESVQLLIKAGASPKSGHLPIVLNGCVSFEEEEMNWKQNYIHYDSVPDTGSLTVNDRHRTKSVPEFGYLTTRLDEILALLTSILPWKEDHFDNMLSYAARSGFDYTVDCLMRVRNRSDNNNPSMLGHHVFACIARRHAVRTIYENGTPEGMDPKSELEFFMSIRDYHLAQKRLAREDYLNIQENGGIILHILVRKGFASLLAQVLTPEQLALTEDVKFHEELGKNPHISSEARESLLISACRRELPNMDVISVLVEQFNVNVNYQTLQIKHRSVGSETALHILARGDHWWYAEAISYLVNHGANTEMRDNNGLTPLNSALDKLTNGKEVNMRAVEVLVQLGADINSVDNRGMSCLARASANEEVLKLLLSHGAAIGPKDVFEAIKERNYDSLEVLLRRGADPNGRTPSTETHLVNMWNKGQSRMFRSGLENDQLYPLHYAATFIKYRDNIDTCAKILKLLLEYGADPNARYQDTTVAHQIIEHGVFARLLLEQPSLNTKAVDSEGVTIFLAACHMGFDCKEVNNRILVPETPLISGAEIRAQNKRGKADAFLPEILLKRGVNIHAQDKKGRNALHHLLSMNHVLEHLHILHYLASEAELVNNSDEHGRTPIYFAVGRSIEEFNILLAAGADPWIIDNEGNTLLHIAFRDGVWREKANSEPKDIRCEVLDRLLELPGADKYVNARNEMGETPIFEYFRRFETIRPRRERFGMPKDIPEPYREPAFSIFDAIGVDWGVTNNEGSTLLHVVANKGLGLFSFLLKKGLDPRAEDMEQNTPLDKAAAVGAKDVLDLFKGTGGNSN